MIMIVLITLMGWFAAAVPADLYWRTGTAVVSDEARSAFVEDAGAEASGQVPLWFDAFGFAHDHGWPSCLTPAGATVTIRFAVNPEGTRDRADAAATNTAAVGGTRPIVAVDCRQT